MWVTSLALALPMAGRAESPLDRLRQRSADERWETIRPTSPTAGTGRSYVTPAGAVLPPPAPAPTETTVLAPSERGSVVVQRPIVPTPTASMPRPAPRSEDVLPMLSETDADSLFDAPVRGLFDPPGAPGPLSRTAGEAGVTLQSPGLLPVPAEDVSAQRPADGERIRPRDEQAYELANIQEILPYADYEPDPELAASDPYANQCPCVGCPPGARPRLCPEESPLPYVAHDLRSPSEIVFAWEASNLYSNPLYFDDPKLERYGHTYHPVIQPFVSTGRFGVQLVALPYKATIDPYWKRMYALGFYRPGDCAPQQIEPIPWNRDAALIQGAATTGAVFLIP